MDTHNDMYDEDGIYLGPDRCVREGSWIDSHESEHEWSCIEQDDVLCGGAWWCADHIDDHRDDAHGCWCEGTGMILFDGVLVPCIVCD